MRPILIILMLLLAQPALAAHTTRLIGSTQVRDAGSSTANIIGFANVFMTVTVFECDRGIVWCHVGLPGPDGWVPASKLRDPVPPTLPIIGPKG
jgi:uncharacterized protein YraI